MLSLKTHLTRVEVMTYFWKHNQDPVKELISCLITTNLQHPKWSPYIGLFPKPKSIEDATQVIHTILDFSTMRLSAAALQKFVNLNGPGSWVCTKCLSNKPQFCVQTYWRSRGGEPLTAFQTWHKFFNLSTKSFSTKYNKLEFASIFVIFFLCP